jgi:phosphatidylserine/phosphatidylglycerophosphate/cardiolipin synthase-like enzyme
MTRRPALLGCLMLVAGGATALQPPGEGEIVRRLAPLPAAGSVQYAFPPHDRADLMIIEALDAARAQILVQAFTFTDRRIADALIRARRRGIDVRLIIDSGNAVDGATGALRTLGSEGIAILVDDQHGAAHNKVVVIDATAAACAVITGSYNFTYSAQRRNAENALVLRGNPRLCAAYQRNFEEHRVHSHPLRSR